ncbi:MAG: fumarate hydratase [Candidatus Methanospirareceae archaeon]
MITKELIRDVTISILRRAEVKLPRDIKKALTEAYEKEDSDIAKMHLRAMLENVKLAEETLRPLCQDTGVPIFYVNIGKVEIKLKEIEEGIREGVKEATEIIPLRKNIVDPITRAFEGREGNVGNRMPYIQYRAANIDYLEIITLLKGGGGENVSAFGILTPNINIEEEKEAIKKFVVKAVLDAGAKPCPPYIVGIGIGGTAEVAMSIAKEALLRPVGARSDDIKIAELEEELLQVINNTGIGPMGLGGKTTALDVHIETADTHITSLPVAVNIQCWAARRGIARIYESGVVEYV